MDGGKAAIARTDPTGPDTQKVFAHIRLGTRRPRRADRVDPNRARATPGRAVLTSKGVRTVDCRICKGRPESKVSTVFSGSWERTGSSWGKSLRVDASDTLDTRNTSEDGVGPPRPRTAGASGCFWPRASVLGIQTWTSKGSTKPKITTVRSGDGIRDGCGEQIERARAYGILGT